MIFSNWYSLGYHFVQFRYHFTKPCVINDGCYMLHICSYALVTQNWWQNVSQGKGGSCVEGMVQDWIGRKTKTSFVVINVPLSFAAIKFCSELCCQSTVGHLPQHSTKCLAWTRHLRRLTSTKMPWNWRFRSMHLIGQKKRLNFGHPTYTYYSIQVFYILKGFLWRRVY